MIRNEKLRPGMLVRCASRACALAFLLASTNAAIAQDRDPFSPAPASDATSGVKVSKYLTVDLHVQDEDLANVLQMLSIQSERNIVMSSDISANVTADLYNVTFYEALEAILNVNGYGYIERGNFIYVYTLDEIKKIEQDNRRPISKVITLDYLNANDAAEFCGPLLSEIGQIKTNGDVDTFSIPDDNPVGDEQFALAATLVVIDYPEYVDEVVKLIKQLDTKPAQVLIEATILQTSLTEANAFGVDFSFLNNVNFTDFMNVGGPLGAAAALIKGGDGASGNGFTPPNNNAVAGGSTVGNTSGPGGFKLGVIKDDFSVFIRLLDEVADTTVLSNPKILAINRAPARVLVGRRIGFLNTTSTQTSTTQTVEFLDTGTQLSFRPFIATNGDIRMELNPSVSEGVIRQATDGNGANVTIPDEITQELATNVIVHDGSTIVLGGLFKETTVVGRKQIPIVGDLPVIGAAFRGHDDSTNRSEIIFLITPTIMKDDSLLAQGDEAMDEVRRVHAGSRTGLLPWSRDRMSAKLNVEAERLADKGETERALWKLRRSLTLNHRQPEAIELRERLLGETQTWPSRSLLKRVLDKTLGSEEPVGSLPGSPSSSTASRAVEPADDAAAGAGDQRNSDAPITSAPDDDSSDGGSASIASSPAQGAPATPANPGAYQAAVSDLKLSVTMTPGASAPNAAKPASVAVAPVPAPSAAPSKPLPNFFKDSESGQSSDDLNVGAALPVTTDPLAEPKRLPIEGMSGSMGDTSWRKPKNRGVAAASQSPISTPGVGVGAGGAPAPSAKPNAAVDLSQWLPDPLMRAQPGASAPPARALKPLAELNTPAPSAPAEMQFLVGDGPIPPRYNGVSITSGWRSIQDILRMSDTPLKLSAPASAVVEVDPEKN